MEERISWIEHKGQDEPLFDEAFLRRLERLTLLSRRALAGQLEGERRSPKRGGSVEFADFRPYAPGDDFRQIDWNAYARLERFYLKLFLQEEDLCVHLLLDASKSMDWGRPHKFDYARRLAGALGYVALCGLDRVTIHAFYGAGSRTFAPHRGRGQAMALFAFLGNLPSGGAADLAAALRSYVLQAPRPGPLLLISDLLDPHWAQGLRALRLRPFEVTVLHLLSPDEVAPDLSGDLRLLDVETEAPCEITADPLTLRRYRQGVAAWREEVRQQCQKLGLIYVPLETDVLIESLIWAVLRQRGVLR
ncbi:MAG: DUF58 domain-containing protein [Chloroflexia bacterium]|nr:DUF58 domain-containing protein [Chloroflexia bacterium]